MNTTIRCPFCEQEYEIENFKEGSEVECAKCKNSFTLETFLITDKLAKQQIEATLKQQNVKEIAEVNTNKQNYTHPSNPSKSFSEKQFEEEFKKPILARVLNILAIISAIASILFFLALLGEILFLLLHLLFIVLLIMG